MLWYGYFSARKKVSLPLASGARKSVRPSDFYQIIPTLLLGGKASLERKQPHFPVTLLGCLIRRISHDNGRSAHFLPELK